MTNQNIYGFPFLFSFSFLFFTNKLNKKHFGIYDDIYIKKVLKQGKCIIIIPQQKHGHKLETKH